MKAYKKISIFIFPIILFFLFGPKPSKPQYNNTLPNVPNTATAIEQYVVAQEKQHNIKPNNEARIIWNNDSTKNTTDYAIVYLHGFSASQEEGNPVHRNIAKKFGCNLYLARLAEHGIDTTEALANLTAQNLWESAKQAYAIGKTLGKKVILMSTSTGGTLSLKLAAEFSDIAGIILYSPNIAINDPNAWFLNNSWGLQVAKLVKGSPYNMVNVDTPVYNQYWNQQYRLEATTELEELIETTMTKDVFSKVNQPTLVLYYYKNKQQQDNVVRVSAMKEMFKEINTHVNSKRIMAIPNAANHVLASPILSKDIVSVEKETTKFLQEVMGMKVKE